MKIKTQKKKISNMQQKVLWEKFIGKNALKNNTERGQKESEKEGKIKI